MAVKKISKVQPEKFEFNKKNKETADSIIKNYPSGKQVVKWHSTSVSW